MGAHFCLCVCLSTLTRVVWSGNTPTLYEWLSYDPLAGEPLNRTAWEWYHRIVGEERCTVVDTWWQTGK